MRRRTGARLAHRHADTAQHQLPEIHRQPAYRCHHAPGGKRPGDHIHPRRAIRQPRNGNAHGGVKNRKRHAGQKAKLRIGKLEILADRLQQDRQNLPVNEIENIDDQQYAQNILPVTGGVGRPLRGFNCHLRLSRLFEDPDWNHNPGAGFSPRDSNAGPTTD